LQTKILCHLLSFSSSPCKWPSCYWLRLKILQPHLDTFDSDDGPLMTSDMATQ
jgi:hypothetical protein